MSDFIPPLTSLPFIRFAKAVWPLILRWRYQVCALKVVGDGLTKIASLKGQRVIMCPNHPTSSDPDVMFLFSKLAHENFRYLAAREIFRGSHGIYGLLLRLVGCYSVRRGVVDRPSYRAVTENIAAQPCKIVIFPEGELSHQYDKLMPLEPGVAQIGFWALEHLKEQGNANEKLYILPLSISYAYTSDPRYHFDFALGKIEEALGMHVKSDKDLQTRLEEVCQVVLSVLEHTYDLRLSQQSMDERLKTVRCEISRRLATIAGVGPRQNDVDTLHVIRDRLDRLRFGPHEFNGYAEKVRQEQRLLASLMIRDFHRIMNLRFCIERCSGPYAWQEMAEALCLLEHEVLGEALPCAKRIALIAVGDAFELNWQLPAYQEDRQQTLVNVNERLRAQLMQLQNRLTDEVMQIESNSIPPDSWSAYHRSCLAQEEKEKLAKA